MKDETQLCTRVYANPQTTSNISSHPVFVFLTALWGLSHKYSATNGAEEQETTGYTETSDYTADRHMHACAKVVFVYVSD